MRLPYLADDPETRSHWRVNQLQWLCVLAIGIWAGFTAAGVGGSGRVPPVWFAVVLFLGTVNLALRSASALRRSRGSVFHRKISWVFTTLDFLLIAAGLRLTGGAHSPLWIVLFVVVVAETILSPPGEALLIRWGAGAALLAGTWSPSLAPAPYLVDLATRVFFLTIVSIITRRLRLHAAEKDEELAVLRAELAAAGERARLSREVHDGIGNALAAAVLRLEVAARVTEKRPEETGATLKEEAQALREAMDAVRDWTFFTRPWPTGAPGVPPSQVLAREVERLSLRTGLPVTVEGGGLLDDLPEAARGAALRISQEALTNAAKYARAGCARVVLQRDGRFVRVSITDDGCGFDAAAARPGIGLTSMRERAESLGGTLAVSAASGCGVTVTARLPVA